MAALLFVIVVKYMTRDAVFFKGCGGLLRLRWVMGRGRRCAPPMWYLADLTMALPWLPPVNRFHEGPVGAFEALGDVLFQLRWKAILPLWGYFL